MPIDRLQVLLDDPTHVGIDFVRIEPSTQQTLWVFFLDTDVNKSAALEAAGAFTPGGPGSVRIASTSPDSDIPSVEVVGASWGAVSGRRALRVDTATPGDFSIYRLTLVDPPPNTVDPYFGSVTFTFKAGCESRLDCKPPTPVCPPEAGDDVLVDYTARDWQSYRRALLEMVSLRYPHYVDRLEADLGILVLESFAALADELTYTQDRVAREAHLETATQRRSVRRHARFVDYEMHDGLAASTWLAVEVDADVEVPAGTAATSQNGVVFEVGEGIERMDQRRADGEPFVLRVALEGIGPYLWDEDDVCLPAGSTEITVAGHVDFGPYPRRLLLRSVPRDPAARVRFAWVVLEDGSQVSPGEDPLTHVEYTRITWSDRWATPEELPLLETDAGGVDHVLLTVHANLLPVVAGSTLPPWSEPPSTFQIRPDGAAWSAAAPHAIEREGRWVDVTTASPCADAEESAPVRPVTFLFPLAGSSERSLAWTPTDPDAIGDLADEATLGRNQAPEVLLRERLDEAVTEGWSWRRTLLGSSSATATDAQYTLEDGLWEEVVRYWRGQPEPVRHFDYRTGDGYTLRFGDGEFGKLPARGRTFELRYRLAGGAADNLPAERTFTLAGIPSVLRAFNPLPITNGLDRESEAVAKIGAPEAWRTEAFRAVTTSDYAEALEKLEEVERASAVIRWTGSWNTVFATPDPVGRTTLTPEVRAAARDQLGRYRQAGRPAHVLDPVYAWLNLRFTVCVCADRYRGQVQAEVRAALVAFFHPDGWTFGDPLHRSALEAVIHGVPGVCGVERIEVRRRGFFAWRDLPQVGLLVESNAVIGVADDPLHPERGSLAFVMEGGA